MVPLLAQQDASLIHWWTVLFQIVNFLILVALLRVFLYRRVLRAMDRRERKIAEHFGSAQQAETEAKEQAAALQRERTELARKRESMLQEAREESEKHRRQLIGQARQDADRLAGQWREDLQREKESFLREMQSRAGEQVCTIARRALEDLADVQLEGYMIDVLLRRFGELSEEDAGELAEAIRDSKQPLVVATAWELAEKDRGRIAEAAREHLHGQTEIEFQTDPRLACGIELRAAGREVSWTIDSYVGGIREQLAAAIDEKIAARPQAAAQEADDRPPAPAAEKKRRPPKRKRPARAAARKKNDADG